MGIAADGQRCGRSWRSKSATRAARRRATSNICAPLPRTFRSRSRARSRSSSCAAMPPKAPRSPTPRAKTILGLHRTRAARRGAVRSLCACACCLAERSSGVYAIRGDALVLNRRGAATRSWRTFEHAAHATVAARRGRRHAWRLPTPLPDATFRRGDSAQCSAVDGPPRAARLGLLVVARPSATVRTRGSSDLSTRSSRSRALAIRNVDLYEQATQASRGRSPKATPSRTTSWRCSRTTSEGH